MRTRNTSIAFIRPTDPQAVKIVMAFTYIALAMILASTKDVCAATVKLGWDTIDDQRIAYYEVQYGATSGVYDHKIQTSDTNVTIEDLSAATLYYFAARACDQAGANCSSFSNELAIRTQEETIDSPTEKDDDNRGTDTNDTSTDSVDEQDTQDNPNTPDDFNITNESEFPIEIGDLKINHTWQWIPFRQPFSDPVIVVKALSFHSETPAVIRIKDVSSHGFSVRVQEWDYEDDWHPMENASYIVMERGSYELPDGTWIEAGYLKTSATSSFEYQAFSEPFSSSPVVLAAVTTFDEEDAVNSRIRKITKEGFFIGMREQESNTQTHAAERIDYIAWQESTGEIDGLHYEVGRTRNRVSHAHYDLIPTLQFAQSPTFVADMQTTNGADTSSLRWKETDAFGKEIWVQEERSKDDETGHTNETVGYIFADVD